MGIEVINPKEIALREKKRTVVMNTRKLHAWVHYYPNPGDHDELHCHNEDQVFTCFEGECTMNFPDGFVVGAQAWHGRADHRRFVLSAREHGHRPHDPDGQSLRQSGQCDDHRLCDPQGHPQHRSSAGTQPREAEQKPA